MACFTSSGSWVSNLITTFLCEMYVFYFYFSRETGLSHVFPPTCRSGRLKLEAQVALLPPPPPHDSSLDDLWLCIQQKEPGGTLRQNKAYYTITFSLWHCSQPSTPQDECACVGSLFPPGETCRFIGYLVALAICPRCIQHLGQCQLGSARHPDKDKLLCKTNGWKNNCI